MNAILREMEQSIINGDEVASAQLAQKALEAGIDPMEALEEGYGKGMSALGDMFENGEVYLTELLLAEDALNKAIEVLQPEIDKLKKTTVSKGKVVICTIQGDVHDIGKNILKLFLSVSGFACIDLGRDVPVKTIIDTAVKEDADIIATSALMTTTMIYMPELIKQLGEKGLRDRFKVMVGGAPVIKSWADEIGADGYARGTKGALEEAFRLVK